MKFVKQLPFNKNNLKNSQTRTKYLYKIHLIENRVTNSQYIRVKNNSIRKWTKNMKRPTTEKDAQRANKHMKWCSMSLDKDCKLKPQWDIITWDDT